MRSFDELFRALVTTTSSDDVRKILTKIGDSADVGIDEPFGPLGVQWHAFGDRTENLATINLATKSGRSITERLTNATDAILEARVPVGTALPTSARAAASQWFGRPVSSPDDGLFNWDFSGQGFDRLVNVVLSNSDSEGAPTVDVLDRGVGVRPDQFGQTILSLQAGNKVKKFYLVGAFGQGGASTLAFSDYVLVVSRHKDDPRRVGFTLIRVLNLNASYKEDAYAYLAIPNESGGVTVPSIEMDKELALYEPGTVKQLPSLKQGTLVRHYGYKLPRLTGALGPAIGNLYHYFQSALFDPLLPFRVIDIRDPARAKDELITGSRNRLMRLLKKAEEGEEEGKREIRLHRPMEFVVPYGSQDPSIGIEYWVVLAYRKGKGARKNELVLRSQSNELFLQPGHPIIGTLNGQNQGELTAQLLKELGLGMVARHIVVHIDASRADNRVRRELFSSTREGFKEGDVLRELTRVLEKILKEDDDLAAVERELTEKLVKEEAEETSKEVVDQITKLLLDAGLQVKQEGIGFAAGEGEKLLVKEAKKRHYRKLEPLPTQPFPGVSKWKITAPQPEMRVRINDNEVVLVETDADAEFDRRGLLSLRIEPPVLEQAGKAPLRGGRIRWRLRPRADAKEGERGKIVATITRPDGTQLSDQIDYEVLAPREERSKREKGWVPPFKILGINPDDNPEQWGSAWPDLGDEADSEDQAEVAYRPMIQSGSTVVYYSTIFRPFREQMDKLKTESAALAEFFQTAYKIWIGYHAILQEHSRPTAEIGVGDGEAENYERLMEDERIRVARMQVKQALQTAQLRKRLVQEEAVSS